MFVCSHVFGEDSRGMDVEKFGSIVPNVHESYKGTQDGHRRANGKRSAGGDSKSPG